MYSIGMFDADVKVKVMKMLMCCRGKVDGMSYPILLRCNTSTSIYPLDYPLACVVSRAPVLIYSGCPLIYFHLPIDSPSYSCIMGNR